MPVPMNTSLSLIEARGRLQQAPRSQRSKVPELMFALLMALIVFWAGLDMGERHQEMIAGEMRAQIYQEGFLAGTEMASAQERARLTLEKKNGLCGYARLACLNR